VASNGMMFVLSYIRSSPAAQKIAAKTNTKA